MTPEERMARLALEYSEPEDAFERAHRLRSRPKRVRSRVTKKQGYGSLKELQWNEVNFTRHDWMRPQLYVK